MSKYFLILILLTTVGCANRGYDSLAQEVPELFPDFDKSNYVKLDLPKNKVYVQKILPESEKKITEFNEINYLKKQKPKSYEYYVPIRRMPSSVDSSLFDSYQRIRSSYNSNIKSILIE